ncbi:MAG: aspartyl protease family protein [Bacteroidetes bacterium]|nr:aspartyl protease family protein [Bacteroidota bacterium]
MKNEKMFRYCIFFTLLFLLGCDTIKTVKIIRRGEVDQKQFKTQIPFEFKDGLIIVKVGINGVEYNFIVDTGAPNVLSTELATELKLKNTSKQKVEDSHGASSALGFTTINKLTIGGIDFLNTGAAIADLKQNPILECHHIKGFIGANLMRKAIWEFDFKNKMISIANSIDSFRIPSNANLVPFYTDITGTPFIDMSYNGLIDKNVTVDFGYNGNIETSTVVFNKLKQSKLISDNTCRFGCNSFGLSGRGNNDTIYDAVISKIKIGDITLTDYVVSFNQDKSKSNIKLIGTAFFKNYRIILNWNKNKLILIKNNDNTSTKAKGHAISCGFAPIFEKGILFIGMIDKNSDSEKQGLKIGDEILEVNGTNYRNFTQEKYCEIVNNNGFFSFETDTIILITIKRDSQELKFKITPN